MLLNSQKDGDIEKFMTQNNNKKSPLGRESLFHTSDGGGI